MAHLLNTWVALWAGCVYLQPAAHGSSRCLSQLALAGLGIDWLSDAVLKAFNETQPGMMGFSEDTVRQLV